MKYLFVLFLAIGVVSAYTQEDQDEALANSDVSFMNLASDEDQAKIVEKLQEALRRTVESLKERLDQGHEHGKALILRAHKLSERLQQMHADMGEKLRQAIESYQGKAKEFVDKLKEQFNKMRKPTESPVVGASLEEQDEALANADISFINFASSADQDEYVRRLQEALKRTVESVKQLLDESEKVAQDMIVRAHKLAEKLRILRADMGQQVRQVINSFRGAAQEFAQRLRDYFRRPQESPRVGRSGSDMGEMDEALANSDVTFINFDSDEDRTRYVTRLQEALKRTVEALKNKLDQGHDHGSALILRAHKLSEKLQQMHADMGEKLRQAIESYQGQAQEFAKKLAEFFQHSSSTTEATH